MSNKPLSDLERIKTESNYLRGTLVESLADPITGALAPDDQQLIKFHGAYQQTDRDFDEERRRQKLEPLTSFMIRVRVPSGVLTPKQWLDLDALTEKHCKPTLKLTTRQAVELHGVVKRKMKTAMQGIHATLLDSLAGCGDVNRNVMTSANPWESEVHQLVYADALKIHQEFTPKTTAYHEIWLDDELVAGGEKKEDHEPLYGKTYLPRKFKVAIAIPPRNDVDVFANDLGFIAIVENGQVRLPAPAETSHRVAIVGAGPSGLAAASFLALNGVQATIFEASDRPGGMMNMAPIFRLPRDVIQADIERITALGVEIKLSHAVTTPPEGLLRQGFEAVYVACGFPKDTPLNIEGNQSEGVFTALELLAKTARGEKPALGARVLVVGGGNTAMDAARTAQRLSGQPVTLVYRRDGSQWRLAHR